MDPIANMLTTILNAQRVGKKRVAVPYSRHKKEILDFLQGKGYIAKVRVQESPRAKLVITLAYDEEQPRLHGVKRLSKPGQRYYAKYNQIPYTYANIGEIVISTSTGMMTDREARKKKIGGELICAVW